MSSTEQLHPLAERIGPDTPVLQIIRAQWREEVRAVEAVDRVANELAALIDVAVEKLKRGGRLIYVGAGTSGRLATLDAAECPPTFGSDPSQVVAVIAGGPEALVRSVEGAEDDRRAGARAIKALKASRKDVVVGVSASGRAPFVLAALASAKKAKATTALLSCNPSQAAKAKVDHRVCPDTGAELIAGSTRLKAGTATKLLLNALSTATMVRLGRVERGRMSMLKASNTKLSERAVRIVVELGGVTVAQATRALEQNEGSVARALGALAKKTGATRTLK